MEHKQPLKVELVGLSLVFYSCCAKCQILDYFKLAGIDYVSDQISHYPKELLMQQRKLGEVYARLLEDFGGRVVPVAVGLVSLRGLRLSLKHKAGKGFSIVIDGKRVLAGDLPYETIKCAIEENLAKS